MFQICSSSNYVFQSSGLCLSKNLDTVYTYVESLYCLDPKSRIVASPRMLNHSNCQNFVLSLTYPGVTWHGDELRLKSHEILI